METGTVLKRQQLNQTVIFFLNNNNDDGKHQLAISMSIPIFDLN
jgi:hypothetical protein